MKLSQLKIDPEFQSKIPPLQFEEEQQLEQNILAEGRLLNPTTTKWRQTAQLCCANYRALPKTLSFGGMSFSKSTQRF